MSSEVTPAQPASQEIALFLADVDGTLVDAEKKLTDKTRAAVQKLRDAGIAFTITSGRPPRGLAPLVKELAITAPIAAFNGGLYIEPDGTITGAKTLPADVVRQTVTIMQDNGLKAWIYRGEDWYVLDADRHGPHVDREEHTVQFAPILVPDGLDALPNGLGDDISKIVGVSDDAAMIKTAEEAVHNAVGAHVSAALSQPYYLDVTHPEANKGSVVAYLARAMHLSPSEIATIGDQPNDVLMFVPSGLSIAMGNANDYVKHAAHETVAANTAEGFAEAVERVVLPRAKSAKTVNKGIKIMTDRTSEILSWYGSDNVGTLTNLARILNHGHLGGTGKVVILPVDQGFEHGPARSFAANPPAYDPRYHFQLALDAGLNAYAAPLGFLEAGARDFAGSGLPLILKANDHDLTMNERDPNQALTASVHDALRLGCAGIGFTIYPGSSHRLGMYEQIRALSAEAKGHGLAVIIWSYPRGSEISKEGETGVDICGYAAHIAAQLGAHIIKVKLPSAHIEQEEARKVYEAQKIPIGTLAERVRHIASQCVFGGRRIVIFSGGTFGTEESLLEEARGINEGGGFGSIMGRNTFQRSREDALRLLGEVVAIYKGGK